MSGLIIKVAEREAHCQNELRDIFKLRAKIFVDRLKWDVQIFDGMEVDGYDALDPRYLTVRSENGAIVGCWRILSTEGPYMLKNSFVELLNGMPAPSAPNVWELSRFALDGGVAGGRFGFSDRAVQSIAAVLSYGCQAGITHYVTVTTPAVERMLRRLGVVIDRFGGPRKVSYASPVALWIDIGASYDRLCDRYCQLVQ
ncbi:acyl-homoserine-lactone synthase (plasmid) [Burkholderia sp. FERM BP-3421]|uniref:acyl-homoserine-lactone synthase n=1 Tax=Burkholderia sp. FERM BP-3421 TaxID=1494466 RepID=UPI00235E56C9|nr:acyl-homoserine-lactone synthase [Burkholderia sp. FERM BP-3421]WDD90207.1 acyl-homoserine-lactone synthase [Burkholderia sp. FERM BP-3421]